MNKLPHPSNKWTCVHLSDIHFKRKSSSGEFAVNQDLQEQLVADLERIKSQGSNFDAVLVSGDIAFSGQVDEYKQAHNYLNRICSSIGIQPTEVWTIPGNHDINRDEIDFPIRGWHDRVKSQEYLDRQQILDDILGDRNAEHLLLETLKNYNDFAQRYSCESKLDPPLYWMSDRNALLNDGSSLKFWGINSAFACGRADRRGNSLFIGRQQFILPQERGVAWIVLCHHPTDWLADGNELITMLKNRAAVALFGHEHLARNYMQDNLLVLHAGAVNPAPGELTQAAYNVVSFWVDTPLGAERQLVVEVQRREYRSEQAKFVPYNQESGPILTRRISLPTFEPPIPEASTPTVVEGEGLSMTGYDEAQIKRRLIYYFFDLFEGDRIMIVDKLNLITSDIAALSGRELFLAIIDEAEARGMLAELWQEVSLLVPDMPKDPYRRSPPHA